MNSRLWKKIGIITGSILLFCWLALVILTLAFGNKLKQYAIDAINNQLNTPVSVRGGITFSLLSHFPCASITMKDVTVQETLPEKNNLLECKNITLLFNLSGILSHQYVIEKVTCDNGTLSLRFDASGKNNYSIFRKGEGNQDFSLKISEATLNNFLILYADEKNQQYYSFQTKATQLNGDFSSLKFNLSISADAFANFFRSGHTDFLPGRNLKLDGTIACDLSQNIYTFNNSSLQVNGNDFKVNGTVQSVSEGNQLNLTITAGNLKLQDIWHLLPPAYTRKLSHIYSSGDFNFNCTISGFQSARSVAQVNATYELKNATIGSSEQKQSLQNVNLQGSFSNGQAKNLSTSKISISKFSCVAAGNTLGGTFSITNFINPYVDVLLDGSVELSRIRYLLNDSAIKSLSGIVKFSKCYYRGRPKNFSSTSDLEHVIAGGRFELHHITVETAQARYENLNGAFAIQNNKIDFDSCTFKAGSSDLSFEGSVSNLLPFAFTSLNDSTDVVKKLGVNMTLNSHSLVWKELVGTQGTEATSDDYSIPLIFYRLSGTVNCQVGQFTYDHFHAADIRGSVYFLPDKIYFNNISLNAEKGSIAASGTLNIANPRQSILDGTAELKGIDITQLFSETNNFGQNTLTDKNLKGTLTASLSLQSTWENNVLNKNKLHALADVSIEKGELIRFEPMMALGTFLKLNELRDIQFSKLQNTVEIKNKRLLIPDMEIFSTALNVELSGSHGFDNVIDYKIQLNLLRLLTDKFRKQDLDASAADQTTEGFLNLYLTMTGDAGNPVIKYDKQRVKQKIATDLIAEKDNLKQVLQKEFGKQKNEQAHAKDWQPPAQPEYFQFEDSTSIEDPGIE